MITVSILTGEHEPLILNGLAFELVSTKDGVVLGTAAADESGVVSFDVDSSGLSEVAVRPPEPDRATGPTGPAVQPTVGSRAEATTEAESPAAAPAPEKPPRMLNSRPSLCLSMIVRNEAPVIRRCLASVLPIIDYWAIVDTGSTDGTQGLITG